MTPLFGCSNISAYRLDKRNKLGEGTFGNVYRGTHIETSAHVALKFIINHKDSKDASTPITALREIRILKELDHENIIELLDMAVTYKPDSIDNFAMVTPYMDHDLAGLIHNKRVNFKISYIKCYMAQLLEGINYLHQKNYMHRDIKAANILVDNRGQVKIADFGLARSYFGPTPTVDGVAKSTTQYTPVVVTRWYRSPELLIGDRCYSTAIDIWSVGCIFGEFFTRNPILRGTSDYDQADKVFELVGVPSPETMPGHQSQYATFLESRNKMVGPGNPIRGPTFDSVFANIPVNARELLRRFLDPNPDTRITALGALQHEFFTTGPPACPKNEIPTYTSSHELGTRNQKNQEQQHGGPALPDRPPKEYKRMALDYKIPNRPNLTGEDMLPPYRRTLKSQESAQRPAQMLDY